MSPIVDLAQYGLGCGVTYLERSEVLRQVDRPCERPTQITLSVGPVVCRDIFWCATSNRPKTWIYFLKLRYAVRTGFFGGLD